MNKRMEDIIMKKFFKDNYSLAVALMAATTFAACSGSDDIIDDNMQQSTVQKTYTLTVTASKGGDAMTRALSLDGSTLNATWTAGDEVAVYKGETSLGTLTAQAAGTNTTLTGTLTGDIAVSDVLTLKFLSPDYDGQDGTLDYIATHCDYATADVEVASVADDVITTSTDADFQNQQAIVKFTLKNTDGSADLSASGLNLSVGGTLFTVTPAGATSDFYIAVPAVSSQTVALVATVGSSTYDFAKTSVTFANGNYYRINVRMSECVDLTSVATAHVGKVIGADGNVYSHAFCATAAGTTASAMIGYVGEKNGTYGTTYYNSTYNHGLAIALTDVQNTSGDEGSQSMNSASAGNAAPNYKKVCPTSCSGWFLASRSQWNNIFTAMGGSTTLRTLFGTVGGSNMMYNSYWSSTSGTTDSRNMFAYGFAGGGWKEGNSTQTAYVRSVFAF